MSLLWIKLSNMANYGVYMELTCLYSFNNEIKVTEDEDLFKKLLSSGEWFKHPNEVDQKLLEIENEKQIRRVRKPKPNDGECKTETV